MSIRIVVNKKEYSVHFFARIKKAVKEIINTPMASNRAEMILLFFIKFWRIIRKLKYILKKGFTKAHNVVLKDVDLTFNECESTLIIGTSGCGKSTLIKCLTGTTKYDGPRPNDPEYADTNLNYSRSDIAYIPQFPALNPHMKVKNTVKYSKIFAHLEIGMRARKAIDAEDKDVQATINAMGLGQKEENKITELSGGQKQRVSIAKELVRGKSIIIADELDTGLDVGVSRSIIKNLRDETHKKKLTTIVISHNVCNMDLYDKLVVLAKLKSGSGTVVYSGTPQNALQYFGVSDYAEILTKINLKEEGGNGEADNYYKCYNEIDGLIVALDSISRNSFRGYIYVQGQTQLYIFFDTDVNDQNLLTNLFTEVNKVNNGGSIKLQSPIPVSFNKCSIDNVRKKI